MNRKSVVGAVLAATLLVGPLAACGGSTSSPSSSAGAASSAAASTRTIKDMAGNPVTIPAKVESIAITSWKGAFGASLLLGHLDKVVVMADTGRYTWLQHVYPQLKDIPNYGSFNDVNVEKVFQADADIVFSPDQAAEANKKMQGLGMPVFVDGITPANADSVLADEYAEIDAVADVTDSKEVAAEFYKWQEDLLAKIKERVDTIPEKDRKTVLVVRSTMNEVFCENIALGYSAILAGGNLATTGINKYYTTVNPEKVVEWNPDVIFQQIVTSPYSEEMANYYKNWQKDERYKDIKAVKSGDVYIMPMGIAQWGGPLEFAQGVLLMAKQMYPEKFADMDVKKYSEEFYAKFLDHKMTDEDWKIMAPNFIGAKTNGLAK